MIAALALDRIAAFALDRIAACWLGVFGVLRCWRLAGGGPCACAARAQALDARQAPGTRWFLCSREDGT